MNGNSIKIKINTIEYAELFMFCVNNRPLLIENSHIEDIVFCDTCSKLEGLFFKFQRVSNHKKLYTVTFTMSELVSLYNRLQMLNINNMLLLILGKIDLAYKNKIMAVQNTALSSFQK